MDWRSRLNPRSPIPSVSPSHRLSAFEQRCHELTLAVYRATERWPSAERFGLTAQIRRAAASAATNVVEGSARKGPKEFAKFLRYAVSSLGEVSYQLRSATDLGYLVEPEPVDVIAACDHAMRVTWKLCRRMEQTRESPVQPRPASPPSNRPSV